MIDNILPLLERVLESWDVVMKVIGLEFPDVFMTVGRAWDWNIADLTNWTAVGWVVATLTDWGGLVESKVVSAGLEFTGVSVTAAQDKTLHVQYYVKICLSISIFWGYIFLALPLSPCTCKLIVLLQNREHIVYFQLLFDWKIKMEKNDSENHQWSEIIYSKIFNWKRRQNCNGAILN